MNSPAFYLNKTDMIKWFINVAKYVIVPELIYVLTQLQAGQVVDLKVVYAGLLGAMLDLLHRWYADKSIPLLPKL